jgi:hypothetical protein
MATFDLYSKRKRRTSGASDVFSYDVIPSPRRVQVVHLWDDALGNEHESQFLHMGVGEAYKFIVETLRREYGVFQLCPLHQHNGRPIRELQSFLLDEDSCDRVLDTIELTFRFIDRMTRKLEYRQKNAPDKIADEAIEELNERFREHGLGYSYENGELIRVDSRLVHTEVVKPALALLSDKRYAGADEEYRSAYEHFRKGDKKDALTCALKAFESVLKVVCDEQGWKYDKDKATAKTLLDTCLKEKLIPDFWQTSMSGLRSVLENGVPTARNRLGGHGQGAAPVEVPDHLAAYVLHLTAAAIVFLVQACDDAG